MLLQWDQSLVGDNNGINQARLIRVSMFWSFIGKYSKLVIGHCFIFISKVVATDTMHLSSTIFADLFAPRRSGSNFKSIIFKLIILQGNLALTAKWMFPCECHKISLMESKHFFSSKGLVLSGKKPLSQPVLTHLYATILWHKAKMS